MKPNWLICLAVKETDSAMNQSLVPPTAMQLRYQGPSQRDSSLLLLIEWNSDPELKSDADWSLTREAWLSDFSGFQLKHNTGAWWCLASACWGLASAGHSIGPLIN